MLYSETINHPQQQNKAQDILHLAHKQYETNIIQWCHLLNNINLRYLQSEAGVITG